MTDRLDYARQRFTSTLDGLWHLLSVASELDETHLVNELIEQDLAEVQSGMADSAAWADLRQDLVSFADVLGEAVQGLKDGFEPDGADWTIELNGQSGELTKAVLLTFVRHVIRPHPAELLRRSILPVAVASFEMLIGELFRATLWEFPGLVDDEEQRFSLKELESFESIDDARRELVEQRVDRLLHGGVEDWAAWLSRPPLEIDLEQLATDWPGTVEVFLRRNLIIHADSRANPTYLAALHRVGAKELPEIGDELAADSDYCHAALDRLLALGNLLWAFACRRLPSSNEPREVLRDLVDELLREGRSFATYELAGMAETFQGQDDASRSHFKLARLLAAKNLNGRESIASDLDEMDTSALSAILLASYHAVAGNLEAAEQIVGRCLNSGEIDPAAVALSPFLSVLSKEKPTD